MKFLKKSSQLVTGMRNPRVLEELSKRSQYSNNRNRNSGFFNGDFRNGLNEGI